MANFDIEINKRIKFLRKDRNLTQKDFATSIEIKQSTLSDIERGKIGVSTNLLAKITKIYKVSSEWLMYGQNGINIGNADNDSYLYSVSPNQITKDINSHKFEYVGVDGQLNKLISLNNMMMMGYYRDIIIKLYLLATIDERDEKDEKEDSELYDVLEAENRFIEQFESHGEIPNYFKLGTKEKFRIIQDQHDVQTEMLAKMIKLIDFLESKEYSKRK